MFSAFESKVLYFTKQLGTEQTAQISLIVFRPEFQWPIVLLKEFSSTEHFVVNVIIFFFFSLLTCDDISLSTLLWGAKHSKWSYPSDPSWVEQISAQATWQHTTDLFPQKPQNLHDPFNLTDTSKHYEKSDIPRLLSWEWNSLNMKKNWNKLWLLKIRAYFLEHIWMHIVVPAPNT